MFTFHRSHNLNRRAALLLNALVVASLLFSSFTSVAAQDGSTPEPTAPPTEEALQTPEPTLEPKAEPTLEPTADPTAEPTTEPTPEPTAEPTLEPTAEPTLDPPDDGAVEIQGTIPPNDLVANAMRVYLDTEYVMNTSGATVGPEDVENVCSYGDTGSVWYKFTPSVSGIYVLSAYDSKYSPNLSVLRYVSSTSRTPEVCGKTYHADPTRNELAFNATGGYTYLVRASDAVGGGELVLKINRKTCPAGLLCGAAVGGDGCAIRYARMRVLDAAGNIRASGFGEYSGFISMRTDDGPLSGRFTVVTSGWSYWRSLIVNNNVTIPGVYKPSALGYPKMEVNMVDPMGNPKLIYYLNMTAASNPNLGGQLFISSDYTYIYAPAGTYDLAASSKDYTQVVYKPGVMLASNDVPGLVLLDPAVLAQAEFSIKPHELDYTSASVYIGSDFALPWSVGTTDTIIVAAPENTRVNLLNVYASKNDPMEPGEYWVLRSDLDKDIYIYDGDTHAYDFGGALTLEVESDFPSYRLDESGGVITAKLYDGYGHFIYELSYGYENTLGGSLESAEFPPEVETQEWVEDLIRPEYSLYRQGDITPVESVMPAKLTDPYQFPIDDGDREGDWKVTAKINIGPFSGVPNDEVIFWVYERDTGLLDYDEFATPMDVSGMSTTGLVKTLYYTTASYDPLIPALGSKGYASAWFKYIPTVSGYLNIDTAGSDYDTVLNVWQGSPGAFTNRAYNAGTVIFPAVVGLSVTAGQTYYIEVTQYDLAPRDAGVASLEEGGVTIEQIGGGLYLNLAWLPCYSVSASASPATGGTVTRSSAPNCLGTKYSQGTIVSLTAAPKTGYDFWLWKDTILTENPLMYTINGPIDMVALFTAVPGKPALKSPAAGALVHRQENLTFSWYESAPLATTYELQLSTDPAFSGGTVHLWPGLSTTSYTIAAPFLTENTTYYWRVRGVSGIGQMGAWSLVRSLRVAVPPPIQLHVYNDSMDSIPDDALTTAGPWFHWKSVEGATGYTLQISRKPDWSSLVGTYTISGGRNTFLYNANLPAGTQYSWRVRADAPRGPSRWTEGMPFTVPQAPPVPAPVSPASNALTTDYTPLFNWSDVVPAPGQPELDYYEIEIEIPNGNNTFLTIQDSRSVIFESQFEFTESLPANKSYYWHVRACNVVHNCSAWSAGRKLRTALAPPVLLTPLDSTTPTTNRPEFAWQLVPGASGYSIQISRYDDFRSLVTSGEVTGGTTTRFTPAVNLPAPLNPADWLYWRVRANSPTNGPGAWSNPVPAVPWRFKVPAAPPIPVLVSPANAALVTTRYPTLEWNDVVPAAGTPGLSGYYVQFSEDKTFSGVPVQWAFVSNYHLPELQPNKMYYWRVRTENVNTNLSGWSAARSFRVAIETPAPFGVYDDYWDMNGGDDPRTNRPEIRWSAVTNASSYYIQLSRYANFSSLLTSATVSANVYYTNVTLRAGVPIYYRVRANAVSGAFGPSGWMTPAPFTASAALPIPAPVSPANSAIAKDSTVRLDWTDVVMPAGKTLDSYILEIDENPSFHSLPDKYILDAGVSFQDVPMVPTHTYYWRVRSRNTEDLFSGWSAVRSVRAAVAAPLLKAPLAEGVNSLRPTFDWDEVEGASGYTLQIARNAAFTTLVGTYTRNAAQTDYTPTVNLPAYTVLYWRVRANSPTHGPGNWSNTWFTTPNPPSTPTLLSPANSAVLADHTPLLDWSTSTLPAGTEFDHYRLHVCYDIECFALVYDLEVHTLANSYYDFGVTSLTEGTYYYWRVRAENKAGAVSAWSAVRMFRTSPGP